MVKPRGKHTAGQKLDLPLHIRHADSPFMGVSSAPLVSWREREFKPLPFCESGMVFAESTMPMLVVSPSLRLYCPLCNFCSINLASLTGALSNF